MENNKPNQKEFLSLFSHPRFRYIHDVIKDETKQGNDTLDLSWNEKGYGVFFTVNGFPPSGKATIPNLLSLNCNFADLDMKGISQEERNKMINDRLMRAYEEGIPTPTIIVRTKNGVHLYWLYTNSISSPTDEQKLIWGDIQNRLVKYFGGDKQARDLARVLRLPYTKHLKDPSDPFEVNITSYKSECVYTLDELDSTLPKYTDDQLSEGKTPALELLLKGVPVGDGLRHGALAQIAGLFLRGADTPEKVAIARMNYYNWDKKVVGSPERFEERKKELDNIFEGILKLNIKQRKDENISTPEKDNILFQSLLDAIPRDTAIENILMPLKPLLEALTFKKSIADAEIYIRNKVKNELGLKTNDVNSIIKHFKELRLQMLARMEIEKNKAEQIEAEPKLTDEEIHTAEQILKSPTLLYDVLKMVKKLGVVGEEKNVLLHYVILTSRKLRHPLSATVKGDSSSGKSYTLLTTIKLFPKSAYIDLTDATPQSFYYCPDDHFKHKIIVIFEKHGGERADHAIRTLQSEGKLKIQVTVKNPETGQFEAQTIEKDGPTGFVTTTTASLIHSENDTRNISMFPDQSSEQTGRVYESVDSHYLGIKPISEEELKPWHHAQLILEQLPVHIPFVRSFRKYFPKHIVRTRRDYGHFLAIVETVTFLHQKQRKITELHGQNYIQATLADAYMAKIIVENSLSKSIYELPEKTIEVIQKAKEAFAGEQFNITNLAQKLEWDRDTVAKWMKPAGKKGYVTIVEQSKGSKGAEYKLEEKELPGDTFLPSIADLFGDNPDENIGNIYNPLTGEIVDEDIKLGVASTDAPTSLEEGKSTHEKERSVKSIGASVEKTELSNNAKLDDFVDYLNSDEEKESAEELPF